MHALQKLKLELGSRLKDPAQVQAAEGCGTGLLSLDRFLSWSGFPKGAVSLLLGSKGLGTTRLWLQAATPLTQQGRWVAWVNDKKSQLTPQSLQHQRVNLKTVLAVSAPQDSLQLLWVLQELCSLCLFDLVGCDLGDVTLKASQILKLKKISLRYKTAVVLLSERQPPHPFFPLILRFQKDDIVIERALHRPTPHHLERKDLYADTLPRLTAGRTALCG